MNKPQMTFAEGVKISWRKELEIGDPRRITRLAFATVYYSVIHFFCVPLVRVFRKLKGLVILGYRIARHYYFRLLIFIEYGPGAYERMRKEYYRDKTY